MADHRGDPNYVEVFHFLHYDARTDETVKPPSKRPLDDIERIRGTVIEGTGEFVLVDDLDKHGRYYKK